jgi:hypothetical protein
MDTIPLVCQAMQTLFTIVAEAAARRTGFVQRASRLTGAGFVQALTFGFLANPRATRADLAAMAGSVGCPVSPQALDQRMTDAGADCLDQVLMAAAQTMLATDPVAIPLLARFPGGVWVHDTSTVGLPQTLAHVWVGGSNQHAHQAALKLGVRWNLTHGTVQGPFLDHAISNDRRTSIVDATLPPQRLRIADLGFFDSAELARLAAADGWWLSRLPLLLGLFLPDGTRLDLVRWLEQQGVTSDQPVTMGVDARLPGRVLAARVPQDVADQRRRRLYADAKRRGGHPSALQLALAAWTLYVTNVPADQLSVPEALVLGRARWQVELLFKRWKSQGQITTWRSGKPSAIRCELYAKLLAMLVSQWAILVSCWAAPDRSLAKALRIVQQHARCLARTRLDPGGLATVLTDLAVSVRCSCRISRQPDDLPTFQRLRDVSEAVLA